MSVELLRSSGWEFITSNSGGLGAAFFAAEGGSITLMDPKGAHQNFLFGAAGVGLTIGFKLPKIRQFELKMPAVHGIEVGGNFSRSQWPNWGTLYTLATFQGSELSRSDITGVCMYISAGIGLVGGVSGSAMILGMNPGLLAALIVSPSVVQPFINDRLLASATSVLLMEGINVGVQAGGGVVAYVGGLI